MKRVLAAIALVLSLVLCGCAPTEGGGATDAGAVTSATAGAQTGIAHRYASASEGRDLLLSNEEYYAGFTQNDLDFRMQKIGATMEEYQAFAAEQVLDFTDDERSLLDECVTRMEDTLTGQGYTIPALGEIVYVKTTMAEECGAGAYTHGTTVYLSADLLDWVLSDPEDEEAAINLEFILWHELFHCLTRCNPEFRADMYELIHFTVHDKEYELPPSVVEYFISNPDVEHHDSSAVFSIDGKDVECFVCYVTTQHFEKEGDSFFDYGTTALVPVDGTDAYYTSEQADNFDEVFGTNTDYVIDPEECMADNFAYAMLFGIEGWDGSGYDNPEIIEGILADRS